MQSYQDFPKYKSVGRFIEDFSRGNPKNLRFEIYITIIKKGTTLS